MNLSSITQITTAKIVDLAVTTAKLADSGVTTAKIADASVTAAKLAAGAIPSSIPTGAILPFAMDSAPTGWLIANGASISRTTYSSLFNSIGATYGSADGTTFNLPDLRGIFIRGSGSQTINPRKTVTITRAAPAVVTWVNHALPANTPIQFSTTGTLPTGITAGTTYYVRVTGLTTDTFQISATIGGAAIATTSDGSGVHTGRSNTGFSYSGVFSSVEQDKFKSHMHSTNTGVGSWASPSGGGYTTGASTLIENSTAPPAPTATETRPANIAMLYCIKF
jgi:microcystin-dependent protein